ncbi:hypothetical protein HID58_055612 [Brassica napus]|uniref:Uncharacterized protein n=1 Tax=Brassica napus TaxID=3708 RepID=A0ABQ8ALU1_BRANA|nr:hypothetical protein HID58_055612 [Brassica napus]
MNYGKTCPGSSGFQESTSQVAKNQSQSSTNGSTFFIRHGHYCSPQTTCLKVLLRYQESTMLSPSTKMNMPNVPLPKVRITQEATAITSKPQGASRMLNEITRPLLQAQEGQVRPVESSMRILSFGLRVLFNLLILLILGLTKILPLRIFGSSRSIWGMSRSIYADVPGFSIKLSANSDQSPPWGQRLILIKEKKKVLHAQLDPA